MKQRHTDKDTDTQIVLNPVNKTGYAQMDAIVSFDKHTITFTISLLAIFNNTTGDKQMDYLILTDNTSRLIFKRVLRFS